VERKQYSWSYRIIRNINRDIISSRTGVSVHISLPVVLAKSSSAFPGPTETEIHHKPTSHRLRRFIRKRENEIEKAWYSPATDVVLQLSGHDAVSS
jgi:hypothetical protein